MYTLSLAVVASLSAAVTAQYGGYGPYGAPMGGDVQDVTPPPPAGDVVMPEMYPPPMGADVQAEMMYPPPFYYVPPMGADVQAEGDTPPVTPGGSDVQAEAPTDVMMMGSNTTLDDCMVQHTIGELDLCEQCMPGTFKIELEDGDIICVPCLEFSPNCPLDADGNGQCQDFQGCPQCALGPGQPAPGSFPGANTEKGQILKKCPGDP